MKHLPYFLLLFPGLLFAQGPKEQKISASINKVTVFFSGAQVEHAKAVNLSAGKQIVVFEKLTDFVDPNSIQLKSSENATILSVRTRKNFDEVAIAKQDVDALNTKRKKLDSEERKLRDEYTVLLYDEQLLLKNNDLGSQQQAVKMAELKEASVFYHSKLTEIQVRKSQLEDEIEKIIRATNQIEQEINTRRSLPVKNYTEIEIELDVEKAGSTNFIFSYITPNASWKPYYDMRSNGIGAPVLLEAKGLVTQDTGEDWNNVNLVLSTNDPYDNTQEPIIEPWYLNYYTPAPRKTVVPRTAPVYNYSGETVYGEVMDATSGEPLAFAKIVMANNQNTVVSTDINGRFSFVVPRGEAGYTVTYLGYDNQYVPIRSPFTKILLRPQSVGMDQLNAGIATTFNEVSGATYSLNMEEAKDIHTRGLFNRKTKYQRDEAAGASYSGKGNYAVSQTVVAEAVQKDLRMEFQINTPFTIPSDNADHRVAISVYEMKANYEYHTVPKLDPSVYLVAQISGWEKLNLLNGESNLYFDGTFIGKSYVDVNSAKDTLSFSLGKDKKVIVERKRSEEKSKTRAIGNRTKYEVQWDFAIRNNGGASIPFIMKDHFPISTNDDIKVKQGDYPGASLDEKTEILTWRMILSKGETKNVFFNYSVEYSNGQPLYLE
jgi:hypothetical protein